jgi:TRAP transporter TAXI family solute receptor
VRVGHAARSAGLQSSARRATEVARYALHLILAALLLLGAACTNGASPRFLSVATGGTGGVYYPYGGAVARLISEKLPNVQATAEVTGASVDNLKLMQLGKVDLAFTLADTLAAAVSGTGPFKETGPIGSIRTLAVLYTNYTHVVVERRSGIRRVADLKGRVVSVGSQGSGTELIADRVLAAAGLDPRRDITRHQLGASESVDALKDGKVAAFFWSGGVPTPAIQSLAATPGLTIALVPQDELLPQLQRDFGRELYRLALVPEGVYRGVEGSAATVGVTNLLVASSALDDELAYAIVKLLFDEKNALVAAHPEARHLDVPSGPETLPAPLHGGAIRYYKERGWK